MKLSKAINGYFITRTKLSPNTVDIYRWAFNRMCDRLGNPEVEDITEEQLHSFFTWLERDYVPVRMNKSTEPLRPRSIENAWTAMRSFFKWAYENVPLKKRPDLKIERPSYEPAEIIPFTMDEIVALESACERTKDSRTSGRKSFAMRRPTAHRDLAILRVLLDTGIRVSECARLNIRDLNMETGELFIAPFGTGRKTHSRVVVLGKNSKKAVWRYLADREDPRDTDPLFVTKDGGRMDRNNIRVLLDDMGNRAKVYNVHPHRFRHTFAIFYLRNGGDVFTLKKMLGHTTLTMVEHYLNLAKTDVVLAHRNASPVDGCHK